MDPTNGVTQWSAGCLHLTLGEKAFQVQSQEVSESRRCLAYGEFPILEYDVARLQKRRWTCRGDPGKKHR